MNDRILRHLMLHLAVCAAVGVLVVRQYVDVRVERLRDRADDGATTLEWVVIALGVFTLAGLAVAAIRTAVTSRLDQIN